MMLKHLITPEKTPHHLGSPLIKVTPARVGLQWRVMWPFDHVEVGEVVGDLDILVELDVAAPVHPEVAVYLVALVDLQH